jgi:hypothetical protein
MASADGEREGNVASCVQMLDTLLHAREQCDVLWAATPVRPPSPLIEDAQRPRTVMQRSVTNYATADKPERTGHALFAGARTWDLVA